MFSHTENKDMLHPSLPGEETALPQSSLYFFFPPSQMKHKWDDSPWWRCNKALIVSARCEIGAEWVPTAPVSAPALRAANTTPASCNPTAASQRLNNLRLKTHTHTHHKSERMYQPSVSSLGTRLQTGCAHQTWPRCLLGNVLGFFFLS